MAKIPLFERVTGIGTPSYDPSTGKFYQQTTPLATPAGYDEIAGGVGGSVAAADITDAGTVGVAVIQAETAADLRTAAGLSDGSITENAILVGAADGSVTEKTTAQLGIDKLAVTYFDAAPVDGTVCVCVRSPIAFTINSATMKTDSGTVTVAVKIGSTAVTGLSAVAASSSKATTNATAANTVAAGDEINLTFSSASTPVNFSLTINGSR